MFSANFRGDFKNFRGEKLGTWQNEQTRSVPRAGTEQCLPWRLLIAVE